MSTKTAVLSPFSQINLARCIDGFNHDPADWSAAEWTNAIAGEVGEAANLAKKILRHRDGIAGNMKPEDQDLERLRYRTAKEIIDVIIYADLAIQALGYSTNMLLEKVFNDKSHEVGCTYFVRVV